MTPQRRTLLALFAMAFAARVLYALLIGTQPTVNPDPVTYDLRVAERLASGESAVSDPFSPMAPGYPFLLAIILKIFGGGPWAFILLNAFLGGATVVLIHRLGEYFVGRGAGLFSAVWLAAYVHHIHFASLAVRDVTVAFLLAFLCHFAVRPFDRFRNAVWIGLIATALVHTSPQFLLLLPPLTIYFLVALNRHRLINIQYTFIFVLTVMTVSLPWTLRNYMVYREFVPVAFEGQNYTRPAARILTAGSPFPRERGEPGFVGNTVELWRVVRLNSAPALGEPPWSRRHNLVSALTYGLLLPPALWGVWLAIRRRQRAVLVLAGVIVWYSILRGFYGGSERARLPIEPLLMLVAGFGLADVYARTLMRRSRD